MDYENSVTLSLEEFLLLRDQSLAAKRMMEDLLDACDEDSAILYAADVLKIIEKHSSIYAERIDKIRKENAKL